MVRNCVTCSQPIDFLSLSFEQRIIDDQDFCRRCFDEIMTGSYDSDVDYEKLALALC